MSIWEPVELGIDERGQPVRVGLAERNLLAAGEPGAGKSVGLNLIVAHAALSLDCRLILVDGKRVELGLWRRCADAFIGPSITDAIDLLKQLQAAMDTRYDELLDTGQRKITPGCGQPVCWSCSMSWPTSRPPWARPSSRKSSSPWSATWSPAAGPPGIIVVAATQRPSADIIPTSLRDLFGYRWAFRCTTDASSDVILGHGWANEGYTAADIDPTTRGVGWLIAEGGIPRRMKAAYLSDEQAARLAEHATRLRTQAAIGEAGRAHEHAHPRRAGPVPAVRRGRPHTWQSGDSADLISLGTPDHGVSVYLGRCRSCAVPLLAVTTLSEDRRGAVRSSKCTGPSDDPDSHPPAADGGGDRHPGRAAGLRPVGRAGRPVRALLPPGPASRPR